MPECKKEKTCKNVRKKSASCYPLHTYYIYYYYLQFYYYYYCCARYHSYFYQIFSKNSQLFLWSKLRTCFFILLNWSVRPRYTTSVLPYGQLNYGGMKARKIGRVVNILRTILLCLIVSPLVIESLRIFLSFFLYYLFYGELTL